MSIVNTPMGENSFQFDYSTGTTVSEILIALEAEILNDHGWEMHDENAGTNQRCYKALNKDGVTYKYVVLDMSTANSIKLVVYENWNATAHTGTNKANNSDVGARAGNVTALQPGQIFLFVNPRWLAMTTRNPFNGVLNSDPSAQGIFGCFEFTRDNSEDTAEIGVPCHLWMNTSDMYYNNGCAWGTRFRAGAITTAAKIELSTILGKTRDAQFKFNDFMPTAKNPWNQKDWALTLYVHEPAFVMRGRIFGLKATTQNAYLILDRIISKCDEDFMYDDEGTDTEHHIVHCSSHMSAQAGRVIIPV